MYSSCVNPPFGCMQIILVCVFDKQKGWVSFDTLQYLTLKNTKLLYYKTTCDHFYLSKRYC